ncbi:MAG: hypothetical protein WC939_02570 [Acholeplasmataceae bacterium]
MKAENLTIIFSIGTIVVCVVVVILVVIMSENRTVLISTHMVNELKNNISIGTTLGDFIACVYNAFGNFKQLGVSIKVPHRDLLKAFRFWSTNNNFQDSRFNNYRYNENNLTTLPEHLVDTSVSGWNDSQSYGYELTNDNKELTIKKVNNSYVRMMIEEEEFTKTAPKLIRFYCEIRRGGVIEGPIDFVLLYQHYQYYIIIYKLEKLYFNSAELQKALLPLTFNILGVDYEIVNGFIQIRNA